MSGDASVDQLKLAMEWQRSELDRQNVLIDRLGSEIDQLKGQKGRHDTLPEGVVRFAEMALRSLLMLTAARPSASWCSRSTRKVRVATP